MKLRMHFFLCYALVILRSTFTYAHDHMQLLTQANSAVKNGKYTQAIDSYKQLLHYFPEHSGILGNIGYAYKKLHDWHSAIKYYQKALKYDPHNARLQRGISHAYLTIGDFKNGWPAYEYRWVNPPTYNAEFISFIHAGGNVRGKTIIVHSEYGLGDVLHFIRYAQLLKLMGATIIVQSHKRLVPLLTLCPYIDQVILPHDELPSHDFRILAMSLPLAFNTRINTIPSIVPYLYAKKELVDYWQHKLSANTAYKIGVCWQANMHTASDNQVVQDDAQAKSIPLELLESIAKLPGVQLFSLQKNVSDKLKASLEFPITFFDDFDETNGAFMDTAALMMNCDLVITIDTATAHLAGGLGVKTWLLLPHHADWRWLENSDYSPWYPTMTLFRQIEEGNWERVIENIQDLLALFFSPSGNKISGVFC